MTKAKLDTTSGEPCDRRKPERGNRLVYTVPEAGRLLGLGRNSAYEAAKRGDIPTLRVGRLLLVPKIPFHRMLGMTSTFMTATSEMTTPGIPAAEVEDEEKNA